MGNFVKITQKGFGQIERQLTKTLRKTYIDAMNEALAKGADDVAFIAQEMAPYKTGSLELAIQVENKKRYSGWVVERKVWINPRVYNLEEQKRVGEYAEEAMFDITPWGHKNLGALSKQKQAATEYQVGGGFLVRALVIAKPFIESRVVAEMNKAIKSIK